MNDTTRCSAGVNVASSGVNQLNFAIKNSINKIYTTLPVQVEAVTPPYFVDVRPLVKLIDNDGNGIDPGVIYRVPYMRLQAGNCGIIIDPQPGDIGKCNFCMRDISIFKVTKALSVPATKRAYSPADALYTGSYMSESPEFYIKFEQDGTITITGKNITINAENMDLNVNSVTCSGVISANDVKAGAVSLLTHTHTSTKPGDPTSPPIPSI